MREYKEGWKLLRESQWLRTDEIKYIESLYSQLFKYSLESLDALMVVISGRSFRMTDDERLARIDRIHSNIKIRLVDLRKINTTASDLIYERSKGVREIDMMKAIQGSDKIKIYAGTI